jgi:hypothetical protein
MARVIGNATAWCDYHDSDTLALTYGDIARTLGVSKSTARRVARDMDDIVDYAILQWSNLTWRHVLMIYPGRATGVIDPELSSHYADAYNSEMQRLCDTYGYRASAWASTEGAMSDE